MPATESPALADLIAGYASRMHREVSGHHILSPLGAWLLLALVGPAARGKHRDEIEAALGTDVGAAGGYAAALLSDMHPAVSTGSACWHRAAVSTPALTGWLGRLPEETERGDLPTQEQANAWADHATRGLIRQFPLQIKPETVFILATALATRISWSRPFELADAADLDHAWGPDVHQVLRSVISHRVFVADTQAAGRVGVHIAGGDVGLDVISVVAEETVAPGAVLAAAHEAAAGNVPEVSLSELPLGAGHAWKVTEREPEMDEPFALNPRRHALLPAWHAKNLLGLLDKPALGLGVAVDALIELLRPGSYDRDAVQCAAAFYTREGFEAAAITAMAIAVSRPAFRPLVRDLEVRFVRPYAVVAVTRGRSNGGDPWHDPWWGLPVFSGWIERADNAA